MRKANGMGSVTKLSGKRRRPWRARKTAGFDENGKQIFLEVGCFETRKEAEEALAKYLIGSRNLMLEKSNFKQIFEKWRVVEYPKLSKYRHATYNRMFEKCKILHNKKFADIRPVDFTQIMKENPFSACNEIKVLFSKMSKFALKNDIIQKDYSDFIEYTKPTEKKVKRQVFTKQEIEILWQNIDDEIVLSTIIMIYTSLRISEFLGLKKENINLEKGVIERAGLKTEAGKKRVIPIHSKIYNLIVDRYNSKTNFLFEFEGANKGYDTFRGKFNKMCEDLGLKRHTIHDCRHTFATLMNDEGANDVSIMEIMGHANPLVSKKVYTHLDIENLKRNIEMIN